MQKTISRRSFLKSSVAGGLGAFVGLKGIEMFAPRLAKAEEPVRILAATSLSGSYAELGQNSVRGYKLASKVFGGKVLGRPIELIERDTPNPSEGVRKAKEAVEKLGVQFINTSGSSATSLAISEYAAQKGVFCMVIGGSDKFTGSACNKFTFRRPCSTYSAAWEIIPRIIDTYKANTFYTITADYVWGEDLLRNCKEVLKERKKELIGNAYHPIGETEFSTYLTKAMAAKPDCVLFINISGDTVNAVKQAANFGLQKVSKIAVPWGIGIDQMKAIGAKALEGVIWGLNYFYKIDTPKNKALVERYRQEYGVAIPYIAASSYAAMLSFLEAIERVGALDPQKVVMALEGYKYDGITGPEEWRACDHQCIKPYYSVRCKSPKDMKDPEDFGDIIGYSKNFLPCEKTGCSMPKTF